MEQTPEQKQNTSESGSSAVVATAETAAVPVSGRSIKKNTIIAAAVVVALAVAGAIVYKTVYANPGKVWNNYINHAASPATRMSESFRFAYEDHGTVASSSSVDSMFGNMFSKLKVSADGTAYVDYADFNYPKVTVDMNYSFGTGSTSFNSKAQVVMLNKVLYLNMGNNPFFSGVLGALAPGQNTDWIKLDIPALQEYEKSVSGSSAVDMNLDYAQQIKAYRDIMQKYLPKVLSQGTYLGTEKVRGVQTMHYANKLDKSQEKALAGEMIDYMIGQLPKGTQAKPEDVEKAKQVLHVVLSEIIDKAEVTSLETWVGARDSQLYKIKFVSTAPSLASLVSNASAVVEKDSDPQQAARSLIEKTSFDASLSVEEELYDLGKQQSVTAPANPLDLVEALKQQKQKQEEQMKQYQMLNDGQKANQ